MRPKKDLKTKLLYFPISIWGTTWKVIDANSKPTPRIYFPFSLLLHIPPLWPSKQTYTQPIASELPTACGPQDVKVRLSRIYSSSCFPFHSLIIQIFSWRNTLLGQQSMWQYTMPQRPHYLTRPMVSFFCLPIHIPVFDQRHSSVYDVNCYRIRWVPTFL